MARIRHSQARHFMDDKGRMFWINGPEDFWDLSEQRQWRQDISFEDVLEWKQCAPPPAWSFNDSVQWWRPARPMSTTG